METKLTAEELISEAYDSKVTKLSFKGIEVLPDHIPNDLYKLTHLKHIDLADIPVQTLNPEIKNLVNLQQLEINNSTLEIFPVELMSLPSLKKLTLVSSHLSEIPKYVETWSKLTYLNLSGCTSLEYLNGLPQNLNYLNISKNAYKTFPKKIFGLKWLWKIVAEHLGLTEIPEDIFKLKGLAAMFFGYNDIKEISNKIWQISNLEDLSLNGCAFETFPHSVTRIKSLRALYLNGNNISQIPESIKDLKKLSKLELGGNLLEMFPKEILSLKMLNELHFGNYELFSKHNKNSFKIIPPEIVSLQKLKKLDLHRLKVENIPAEIVDEGYEAVKNFLIERSKNVNEEYLHEAKMVMVGRGNVGKTALTKKLTNPEYVLAKTETTKGIDILKNPFKISIAQNGGQPSDFKFNIWDFGGQEKYDATHQLFITNRSIYLFLTEAREESNYLDFYYWLNTISLFSSNSPVIVVLSKFDERRKQIPESIYKEKFKNIVSFVDVSCATDFEHTIENLKNIIKEAINILPQTNQTLPSTWVHIRNELQELSKIKDYISDIEYIALCANHGLDKKRSYFLSQYLNDLGVIIHHQHDLLLRKTVFINTDWCVDGLYKVLDDPKVFDNNGKFGVEDLKVIWADSRFEEKQAELVKLMHEYKLSFELRDGSGFIAPDLLPPDKSSTFTWNYLDNLQFEYRYDFMPAGLLSRLIVKCHGTIKDNQFWKYGVILKYEGTEALIEEDYIHNKIKISIAGNDKRGLLSAIRMYIEEVHKDFDKSDKLIFEEMVPCNCGNCSNGQEPHFFKFNVLKKWESKQIASVPCEYSSEPVVISSLINDVSSRSLANSIETSEDLKGFIVDVINRILVHEITFKGGYHNFWRDLALTQPKNETEIQPFIASTIDHYCKVQGIQLSREVYEANGSVDVLFSFTNMHNQIVKVCLEIKKGHHDHVDTAIRSQLPLYMESSNSDKGIYLVLWFKNERCDVPKRFSDIDHLKLEIDRNNPDEQSISTIIIDVNKGLSPSKINYSKN